MEKLGYISSQFLPPGVNFINIFMRGFFKAFLHTANCNLWNATSTSSTAKCDLRMAQPAQFSYEKVGEIWFQKQSAFCLSCKKAMRKHVDEINARWQHGSRLCFATFILWKITNLIKTQQPLYPEKKKIKNHE